MTSSRVDCRDCLHFKDAPYQAKQTGCYFPGNMPVKQKEAFLDQQQQPGRHDLINARGDCAQYEALPARPSLLQRLFSLDPKRAG